MVSNHTILRSILAPFPVDTQSWSTLNYLHAGDHVQAMLKNMLKNHLSYQ
jgi:hypothetical protein